MSNSESGLLVSLSEQARESCLAAADTLTQAGIQSEALAEYVPERRRLKLFRVAPTMLPIGEVWRLGTLLLHTDGALSELGTATRSRERGRVGYQSLSREARHDIAAAALKGGYPVGTPVNFNASPIDLSPAGLAVLTADSPIGVFDGAVRVRWRKGAALESAQPLSDYLRERSEILVSPPLSEFN